MKVDGPDPIRLDPGAVRPAGFPPPGDWHHAPDHLVGLVAALAGPPPRTPTGEPTPAQWYGQLRRVVDQVWSTAWLAGATDYAARIPARIEIVPGTPLPPATAAGEARYAVGRASVPDWPAGR